MEKVLDIYKRPYDSEYPVVCMDESPKQLIGETKTPIPMSPGNVAKYDYEYKRNGTCSIFLASEPLSGKRLVKVNPRRTKKDWAYFLKDIAVLYPSVKKIILVMDNLNTHTPSSLYETFAPKDAKELWDRYEFVYTPKHGSWLNMAEIELNILNSQCLNRRIDSIEEVCKEVNAWQKHRNNKNAKINWQFTTEDARIKLLRLYPTFEG
jgi:transposase